MSFLPIVGRELLTAARKPGTYWFRFFAGLIMIVIFGCAILGNRSQSSAAKAKEMFEVMSVVMLGGCLAAGAFQTSDCISAEKREGTLGLLFLTDLRGYDVVLGKLAANSLHAYFGLMSVLPMLALPLLMGGVTVGEYWRMVVALLTALFFSMSTGIFVSAASREGRKAIMVTLAMVAGCNIVLPALWVALNSPANAMPKWLLWPCAGYAFYSSSDGTYMASRGAIEFWGAILTILALGLGGLIAASVMLPRVWQDKGEVSGRKREGLLRRMRYGSARTRFRTRAIWLGLRPFYWLSIRDRLPQIAGGILICVGVPIWLLFFHSGFLGPAGGRGRNSDYAIFATIGMGLFFKCFVAMEASRRLSDDRHSGALELLLVTPLGVDQIIKDLKSALWRQFRVPMLVIIVLFWALFWMTAIPRNQVSGDSISQIIFVGNVVVLLMDFVALKWVGMWAGLRGKQHHRAILITLARVIFLPWLLYLMMGFAGIMNGGSHLFFVLWFAGGVVNDVIWSRWAQNRLRRHFRECAASLLVKKRKTKFGKTLEPVTA